MSESGAALSIAGSIGISGNFPIILNSVSGVSSQQLQYQNNGTNKWQLYLDTSNNSFNFYSSANTANRLTLTEAGNLGLGVTPSAWDSIYFKPFEIGNSNSRMFIVGRSDTEISAQIGLNAYYQSGWKYTNTGAASMLYFEGAKMVFRNTASGTGGNALTWTDAMTLNASGNLGLGVTPSAWGTVFTKSAFQFGGSVGVGALWTNSFNNGVFLGNNIYDDGAGNNRYIINGNATEYSQASGQHIWKTAPSGTAGNAISFTQAMTLNASGNLSLGNTNDSYKLDVRGPDGSVGTIRWANAGGRKSGFLYSDSQGVAIYDTNLNDAGIYLAGNTQIDFRVNGSQRMLINSSGNVGLGVTPSAWNSTLRVLEIGGPENGYIAFNPTNLQSYIYWNAYYDTDNRYKKSSQNAAAFGFTASGSYAWYNAPSGTAGNAISFTQAMTLDASGRLGIGTTNLNAPLTVQSNSGGTGIHILGRSGDGFGFLTFRNNANNTINGEIGISDAQNMLFYTGASVRLTIASTGAATFSSSVTVGTDIFLNYDYAIRFKNSSGTYRQILAYADDTYLDARDGGIIFRTGTGGSATERMRITSGGNVGIGTTNPAYKLHINGGNGTQLLLDTTSQYCGVDIANATSVKGGLSWDNTNAIFGLYTNGSIPMTFQTNNTERMRITSGGNVGIGTASPSTTLDISVAEASLRLTSTTGTNFTNQRIVNTGGTLWSGIERSTGGVLGITGAYEAFLDDAIFPSKMM